jgi:hypothetical protein
MKMNLNFGRRFMPAAIGAALLVGAPTLALAGDDSSADVSGGFAALVAESQGVLIKVPVNADGAENTDAAEMRLNVSTSVSDSTNLAAVFDTAVDVSAQPQVSDADLDRDSSTGWRHWNNYGWRYNYYYSYRPAYYYYGNYYNYNYGYNYYYNYYGYNYYYYRRCW